MNYEILFKVLSDLHPVSDALKTTLRKELLPLSLPKSYLLNEVPRIAEYAYFLESGFAMSFHYSGDKKIIDSFWSAGDFILQPRSFFEQIPCEENIQLLESSTLFCITYKSVESIFARHTESHVLYRRIINQYIEKYRHRISDLQNITSRERLLKLLRTFPEIEQIVPQENLASYLGITPQSLSRIKRSI